MNLQLPGTGQKQYMNIGKKENEQFYHVADPASNELEYYYNGNHMDDDIYDFSNTRNLHFEGGFENLTDDEEGKI